MAGLQCRCFAKGKLKGTWREDDIAIGEEYPWRRGALRGDGHCVRFAKPTGGQVGNVDDFERMAATGFARLCGDRIHELAGAVGRSIVDGNDLKADAGGGDQRA